MADLKFFLDTNIILDFLLARPPFFDEANIIFNLAEEGKIRLFCSTHSIATTHYFVRKKLSESAIRSVLDELLNQMEAISVTEEILKRSLKSYHRDFEDAIQIFCAHQIKDLDGIITRNLKDFATSEIEVFSPDEALNYIQNKLN